MNTFMVYAIVLHATGDAYVGSSKRKSSLRFAEHRSLLRRGAHVNTALQNAWRAFGEDAFDFAVIETDVPPERATQAEAEHVARIGSFNLMRPLNDRSAFTHGPEARTTISEKAKAWFETNSEEVSRNLAAFRAAQLAYIQSPEGREAQRQLALRRWQDEEQAASLRAGLEKSRTDPAILAKRNRAIAAASSTPEARAGKSAQAKSFWADPERSAAVREKRKTAWTPERKAARSAQAAAFYAAKRQQQP